MTLRNILFQYKEIRLITGYNLQLVLGRIIPASGHNSPSWPRDLDEEAGQIEKKKERIKELYLNNLTR